jgi:hypothetical protein
VTVTAKKSLYYAKKKIKAGANLSKHRKTLYLGVLLIKRVREALIIFNKHRKTRRKDPIPE